MDEETEEEQKLAEKYFAKNVKPYTAIKRQRDEGRIRLGKHLPLRCDFYAYTYLHYLKRSTIFQDNFSEDQDALDRQKTGENGEKRAPNRLKMKIDD